MQDGVTMQTPRRDKINYYLDIAEVVAERGTCLRRNYGAIIVKDDEIVSTGYAGAPRGRKNCSDLGYCLRQEREVPHGERYEICRSVHAETNAIISASRSQMLGATMYLVGVDAETGDYFEDPNSCSMCQRQIINAGITTVIIRLNKNEFKVVDVRDEWISHDESLYKKDKY